MLTKIKNLKHQKSGNFFLIAGPCAIEEESIAMEIAERILLITNKLKIPFIFKGSYRKANRSRLDSFSGIGDIKANVNASAREIFEIEKKKKTVERKRNILLINCI